MPGRDRIRINEVKYHTYVIPEAADLKRSVTFVYGNYLRRRPKKTKQQLINLHVDGEVRREANDERSISEAGHSSEGDRNESPIRDWDLGTAG